MWSGNRNFKLVVASALLCVMTCVMFSVPTYAANGWDIDLKGTEMVPTASSVAISISDSPGGEILNADKGIAQGMIKRTVNVEIDATNGYAVSVKGDPYLTGANTGQTVPSVALTLNNMLNQWGWYSATGNVDCSPSVMYKAMATSGTTIDSGALSTKTTKVYTLCFGMKVNTAQAADTYLGSVTISAVAEPGLVASNGFNNITSMQDMTPNICKSAAVNTTAQLVDVRDGKKYWVTKLADGNCWMSQNLDLDIAANNVKATDSDVISDWTAGRTTTNVAESGLNSTTSTYAWDLGDYVIINPTATTRCEGNASGVSACSGQFTNVSGWTASSDPNFYKNNSGSPVNSSTKTYDAHYLVGNYYQWNAATAGSGGTMTSGNASASICPKGWVLPDKNGKLESGSFYQLLQQYGIYGSSSGTGTGTNSASGTSGNNYNFALSPLFLVKGGMVDPGTRKYLEGATRLELWSSITSSSGNSGFSGTLVYNSVQGLTMSVMDRYRGISVRCLVMAQ